MLFFSCFSLWISTGGRLAQKIFVSEFLASSRRTWSCVHLQRLVLFPRTISKLKTSSGELEFVMLTPPPFLFFQQHIFYISPETHRQFDSGAMNSFNLACNLSKRSQTMISSRYFSKGPIPTSSTAEVGGVKVIGLDHLSVRCHDVQVEPRIEVSDQPSLTL